MFRAEPHNVEDFRRVARRKLPRPLFEFIDGGGEDEVTMAANRAAFQQLRLVPRLFADVSTRDLSTTVAGRHLSLPVLFSPTGQVGLVHHMGETAAAIVARRRGNLAVISGHGTYSIEEVAAAAGPDPGWFNMFPWGERDNYGRYMDRAAAAGFGGICLTVDTPVAGNRERDVASGWTAPPRLTAKAHQYAQRPLWVASVLRHRRGTMANFDPVRPSLRTFVRRASDSAVLATGFLNQRFGWEDLEWIRARWQGALAVKGGFSVGDATRLAEIGVDALLVGNHGGRQLDGMQASLEQLPPLVDAVGDRLDLVLDGGVRRGSDIVKALCLGAKAVSVGRPWVWGLAADGVDGVDAVLSVLERELDTTMTLLGAGSVSELDRSFLTPAGLPRDLHLG
ncbi:MAG TPA: alpha-hydroxy acid oxidase [Solirubrobacterales bacterium]|nr:alpha-hydroxy acid oxidase [Solirubrobacterales bacterium]